MNDCGLFVCAYITLLSNGLDPSQYRFDQVTLRSSFLKFLADDTIQRLTEISKITIDWGYKWEDKFADLIVQFKENSQHSVILNLGNIESREYCSSVSRGVFWVTQTIFLHKR